MFKRTNSGLKNENFFSRHSHAKEAAAATPPGQPATKSAWAWGEDSAPPPYSANNSNATRAIKSPSAKSDYGRANNSCAVVVCEEPPSDDENEKETGRGVVEIGSNNDEEQQSASSVPVQLPGSSSDLTEFLLNPIPPGQCLYAHIMRNTKGGIKNKMFPRYEMVMSNNDEDFLMAAKKRKKNKTANYLISRHHSASKKLVDEVLGKVRSNFFGTEFMIYSAGKNPKKSHGADVRMELGAVTYAQNAQGTGPRNVRLALPRVEYNGDIVSFVDGEESLLARLKDKLSDGVMQGKNKLPKYDEERNCYTMDFGGRVTMASVKNFQIVLDNDNNNVVLQFGRAGKDLFNMDVRWPMTPLQAFAICLTSLDSKISCE